jgi:uncharacterized protein
MRSVIELDANLLRILRSYSSNDLPFDYLPRNILQTLQKGGILVESEVDEIGIFRKWLKRIQFDFTTIKAVILLTSRCNLNCTYCFEKGLLKNIRQDMPEETIQHLFSWLKAFTDQNGSKEINVYFYGGEPALRVPTLVKIVEKLTKWTYEKGLSLYFYMFTNGTILTPELLHILKRQEFKMIQITLDGPADVHNVRRPFKNGNGSFEIVYRNIKRILSETNVHIRVVVNFDRENYKSVPKLLDMFRHLKENNLEFAYNPVFITAYNAPACKHYSLPDHESAKIWANLYKHTLQRGYRCIPLRIFETGPCTFWRASHLIFDPVGNIYKCIGMPGRNELKIGNVAETLNFRTFLMRVRNLIDIAPWNNARCLNCVYLPLCLGGCRFHSLENYGNIEESFCHKELIELCEMELIKYVAINEIK